MPPTQAPTLILPPGTEVIGLVGEGLANAVFAFSLPRVGLRAEDRSVFRGKLLRLQKAPRDGRANQFPYAEVQKYWENEIRPLFRDPDSCLVRQQLVIIKRDVAAACNRFLAEAENEGDRDDKFVGDWVCEGPQVAMIVDDMRPPPRSLDMMGEFKPKWLTQSLSAPAGSIRCRTCATYLRRFLLKPDSASLTGFNRDCRLRLCDDSPTPPLTPVNDPNVPREGLCTKPHNDAPPLPHPLTGSNTAAAAAASIFSKEALLSSIRAHPLMRELRAIQARLDTCGPLSASTDDASFQKAMTLRDCTCYVYVSQGRGGLPVVSVRLGDLDRKDGATKTGYWRRTEKTLIEGGFYTARRIRVQGHEFEVPVRCVLNEGVGMGRANQSQCDDALVVDVRQVDKSVLEQYGHGIALLETGSEAVLGIRDATKLRRELQKLHDARMTRKPC